MNPHKTRYRTTNWPEYNRSLQSRPNLTVWMSPDIPWLGNVRTETNGRPTVYTDAAIQAVLTMKVLFKLGLRQARGLVSSLLTLLKLDWPVPCFSTVSRRQATLTVNIPARRRAEPLHLLVDSTGIKICGEGEWKVKKHGAEYRRAWRKVHLAIDAVTLDIRAVEMTDHRQGMQRKLKNCSPNWGLTSNWAASAVMVLTIRGAFIVLSLTEVERSLCHRVGMGS